MSLRTADLTDPEVVRECLITLDDHTQEMTLEIRQHRADARHMHREVLATLSKYGRVLNGLRDELAEQAQTLIALDAWRIVTMRETLPQHEQETRRLAAEIKNERDARLRTKRELRELKEDVEEVTGSHKAVTAMAAEKELAEVKDELKTVKMTSAERSRYYVRWGLVVVFTIVIAVLARLWK